MNERSVKDNTNNYMNNKKVKKCKMRAEDGGWRMEDG
jgi:hypothetical protein